MKKSVLLTLTMMLMPCLCLAADQKSPTQSPGMVKAKCVATEAFKARLVRDKSDWEYSDYVSNIYNYDIDVSESGDFYVVTMKLRKSNTEIMGGGGKYFVERKSMKIVKFIGYE